MLNKAGKIKIDFFITNIHTYAHREKLKVEKFLIHFSNKFHF
jgi:hypothetical protein